MLFEPCDPNLSHMLTSKDGRVPIYVKMTCIWTVSEPLISPTLISPTVGNIANNGVLARTKRYSANRFVNIANANNDVAVRGRTGSGSTVEPLQGGVLGAEPPGGRTNMTRHRRHTSGTSSFIII